MTETIYDMFINMIYFLSRKSSYFSLSINLLTILLRKKKSIEELG
jgi:hypothetical protein